jgi:isopentenyl diphosphate isomerase/L-lactate dehydrogenase-like FMN-dependent dehydrogenase
LQAGADIIIAQGTEGGGHVGWMASMPLVRMVVDAVAWCWRAGGYADGRGLVAVLALGADGILLGTRFLRRSPRCWSISCAAVLRLWPSRLPVSAIAAKRCCRTSPL